MKKAIYLIAIVLSAMGNIVAQNGHRCTGINQWVNGSLEGSIMRCYQWNPVNAIAWNGLTNSSFLTKASTRWQNCGVVSEALIDHTLGTSSGSYIYVDPRNQVGNAWQIRQTINVRPNNNYVFTIWVCSMTRNGNPPPTVALQVNGTTLVGTTTLLAVQPCPNPNIWFRISGVWNSGTNSSAVADIVAINPVIGGHDFAVDDISFVGEMFADAGRDSSFCFEAPMTDQLGGNPTAKEGASCDNYSYAWSPTLGLNSSTIANPTLNTSVLGIGSHVYTVTVTDLNGNTCSDNVTITIYPPNFLPDQDITLTMCELQQCIWYQPELPFQNSDGYTLIDPVPGDDFNYNYTGPQIAHCLIPGDYVFTFKDKLNCLRQRRNVHVVTFPATHLPDESLTLTLCELEQCKWYQPELPFQDINNYKLTDPVPGDNFNYNYSGPQIAHCLIPGDYVFTFNDPDNCVQLKRNVHVVSTPATHLPDENITLSLCELEQCKWYQPDLPFQGINNYTLTDPVPGDNFNYNYSGPQIAHCLIPGDYVFTFNDPDNCIQLKRIVHVVSIPATHLPNENITFYLCELEQCKWYQPDLPFPDINNYTLTDPNPSDYYNYTYSGPQIAHCLIPGDYVFTFNDLVNCKQLKRIVHVISQPAVVKICNLGTARPGCGFAFDLETLFQNLLQHSECRCDGPEFKWYENNMEINPVGPYIFQNNVSRTFQKVYYDYVACKKCIYTFTVQCVLTSPPPAGDESSSKDLSIKGYNNDNNMLKLVPNPTSSVFSIQNSNNQILNYDKVEILDISGKVLASYMNIEAGKVYDLSMFSKGMYLIKVKSGDNYNQLKLMLQ